MISLIEALTYRSLKYISQPIGPFHVLIGPNASGKSTFLDVVSFLGRLVSDGLDAAISERTENFVDLVWNRNPGSFELAIEAILPESVRKALGNEKLTSIRYEVHIGYIADSDTEELGIFQERVFLKSSIIDSQEPRSLFPDVIQTPITIAHLSTTAQL